jgi:integrase/recombinase XerD
LLDCGGNAFTLQKLLGHSTLDMTLQYCAIFNADLQKNFDSFNPLEFMMRKQPRQIKM